MALLCQATCSICKITCSINRLKFTSGVSVAHTIVTGSRSGIGTDSGQLRALGGKKCCNIVAVAAFIPKGAAAVAHDLVTNVGRRHPLSVALLRIISSYYQYRAEGQDQDERGA